MLSSLEPHKVWNFFFQICEIPHPSTKEEKLITFLEQFAKTRSLDYSIDAVGNVVIRKDASIGCQDRATIVLQSHMDMVCEKLPECKHDFLIDPIIPIYENGWVKATGTTLGADNGIGVATMLAVLDSDNIIHGEIEALFTMDEETGLTGAKALQPDFINGKLMLNLDSEDDGEIYIGCAGGVDTIATINVDYEAVDQNKFAFNLSISNLQGGHSGDDINKGLKSANVLLARFLFEFDSLFQIQIAEIDGGNLRNAIARDAHAIFITDRKFKEDVRVEFNVLLAELEPEILAFDPKARIRLESFELPDKVFSVAKSHSIILAMNSLPHGVIELSDRVIGLVKTSTNFASIKLGNSALEITTSQRSSSKVSKELIASRVAMVLNDNGFTFEHQHDYPGWESDINSELIVKAKKCYHDLFNEHAKIKEIHAGLECGLIAETFVGMEIISFGPTIKGAHSPDERVEVEAVARFWQYLIKLLDDVSRRQKGFVSDIN